VLIDQLTYTSIAGRVSAKPLAALQVKGRTQPVAVYQLMGLK
jgi:hypothetical protein